jgi:hypothetical protein
MRSAVTLFPTIRPPSRRLGPGYPTRWMGLAILAAWFLGQGLPQPMRAEPRSPEDVGRLILQLGAEKFTDRQAAEDALRGCPRTIVPALQGYEHHADPELRMRVRRTLDYLRKSPEKIPTAVWAFDSQVTTDWHEAVESWRKASKVELEQPSGDKTDIENGGEWIQFAAQSFIPTGRTVRAVEVGIEPEHKAEEWHLLDIREGNINKPSPYVVCRSWVRTTPESPKGKLDSLVFALPDVEFTPSNFYWMVVATFRGPPPGKTLPARVKFSSSDAYPGGRLLLNGERYGRSDLQFTLWSASPVPPLMKTAPPSPLPDIRPMETEMSGAFDWQDR